MSGSDAAVPLLWIDIVSVRHGGAKCYMMKTCSRNLLRQMTETYETRIAGADDFRCALDSLFFTALRAAREPDILRQFDCYKEAERHLLRVAVSSYLNGLAAGMSVGVKECGAGK